MDRAFFIEDSYGVDDHNNEKLKIIVSVPYEKKVPSIPVFRIGSTQLIEWDYFGFEGNPEVIIDVFYIFPTLPNPSYISIWPNHKIAKLQDESIKFEIGSKYFQTGKQYIAKVFLKDKAEISGTSEPFMVCEVCLY
nr:8920_t:CDS:2 [Entrophospora candida]